jgi:hypothetical protein
MKTKLLLGLIGIMFLSGCGSDSTTVGSSITSQTTDDDNEENDDDDSITSYSVISHNQGSACLACHAAPADGADGKDYLSGGTVYTQIDGSSSDTYANGYIIRALLDTGLTIDYNDGRGTGNSYSDNSALSSDYSFTAQVLDSNGNIVNQSATNSHTTSSNLNCNSCHTVSGDNGAPGRITF